MDVRAALAAVWPLFGLSVRTPHLELRYPDDRDVLVLADLATDVVAPGAVQPFAFAWHEGPPDEVRRRVVQYQWSSRGRWSPDAWDLALATVVDGQVVGSQAIHASDFPAGRTVRTGSWLGRAHQGRGIGTEMRAAALHLAFAGLGALRAETGAIVGNEASLAITERLGYRPNGDVVDVDRGQRRIERRFVLDRAAWEARRRDDIDIVGLEACRALFGLGSRDGGAVP